MSTFTSSHIREELAFAGELLFAPADDSVAIRLHVEVEVVARTGGQKDESLGLQAVRNNQRPPVVDEAAAQLGLLQTIQEEVVLRMLSDPMSVPFTALSFSSLIRFSSEASVISKTSKKNYFTWSKWLLLYQVTFIISFFYHFVYFLPSFTLTLYSLPLLFMANSITSPGTFLYI